MNEKFILGLYKKYAPNITITDNKLTEIQEYYQGNMTAFVQDFNSQVLKDSDIKLDPLKTSDYGKDLSNKLFDITQQNKDYQKELKEFRDTQEERRADKESKTIDPTKFDPLSGITNQLLSGNQTYTKDFFLLKEIFEPFDFEVEMINDNREDISDEEYQEFLDDAANNINPIPTDYDFDTKPTIRLKKGDQVFEIPLNLDILAQGNNVENFEEIQENLKKFFTDNVDQSSEEYQNTTKYLSQEYQQLVRDKLLVETLSEEEINSINNLVDNTDILNESADKFHFSQFTGAGQKYTQLIKDAKEQLSEDGVNDPTDGQIEEVAKNLLQRQKVNELKKQKLEDFLSEKGEEYNARYFVSDMQLATQQAQLIADELPFLEFDIETFSNDTDVKMLDLVNRSYDVLTNSRQARYNMTEEDQANINSLAKAVSEKIYDLNSRLKTNAAKIETVSNIEDGVQLSLKNYNQALRFVDKISTFASAMPKAMLSAAVRTPQELALLANVLNFTKSKETVKEIIKDLYSPDSEMSKFEADFFEDIMKSANRYEDSAASLGAIEGGRDFGNLVIDTTAQFLPLIGITAAATYLGRGAGIVPFLTMYGIGKGMKMGEISYENKLKPLADRMSPEQIAMVSSGHGLAEATFEYLTTVQLIKRIARLKQTGKVGNLKPFGKKALGPDAEEFVKSRYTWGTLGYGLVAEPLGEFFTEITQNAIDGEPLLQGADIAAFGGLLMGGGVGVFSALQGLSTAYLSDAQAFKDIKDDLRKKRYLEKKLEDIIRLRERGAFTRLSEKQKAKIEQDARKELEAFDKEFAKKYKRLVETRKISKQDLALLMRIDAQQQKLRDDNQRLEDDYKNKSIPYEVYDARKTAVALEAELNQKQKDAFLQVDGSYFIALKAGDEKDIETYNKYIDKARQEGVAPEGVEKRAEQLFIKDEYLKSLKEFKELYKDTKDLVIKNFTIKQAVDFYKKLKALKPAEIEKAIVEIRSGKLNGFEIPSSESNDGKYYVVGIQENAIKNNRPYTIPHEITHYVFDKSFSELGLDKKQAAEATKTLAEGLILYSKEQLPDVYNKLEALGLVEGRLRKKLDIPIDYVEVPPVWFEAFKEGNHKVEDHAELFHAVIKQFEGEFNTDFKLRTPRELVTWWQTYINEYISTVASKAKRAVNAPVKKSTQAIVDNDPRGYAVRRDKINEFVKDISVSIEAQEEETEKPVYNWDDDIANAVMKYAIDNKIFNTYILGKQMDKSQPPSQFIQEVYRELSVGPARTYDPNKILDNKNRPDFFGWIMKNLRFNALDVSLESIKQKTQEGKTVDIEEARGIAAETGTTVEDFGFTQVADKIGVTPEQLKAISDVVFNEMARYKKGVDEGVTYDADLSPIYSELNKRFAQATDKNPGGGNWRAIAPLLKDLKTFIEGNTSTILTEVTNEYASKNIPQIIEKVIDGQRDKGFVPYPQWVGKKIARELKSETGKKSGPQLMRKIPSEITKLISNPQPLVDIYMPKGKASQGKKEGLAIQLAQRVAREALQNDLLNFIKTGDLKNSPITERLQQTQSLFDRVLSEAKAAEVLRQGDKIKSSFSGFSTVDQQKIFEASGLIIEAIANGALIDAAIRMNLNFRAEDKIKKIVRAFGRTIFIYDKFRKLAKKLKLDITGKNIISLEDFIKAQKDDLTSDREVFNQTLKSKRYTDKSMKDLEEGGRVTEARLAEQDYAKKLFKDFGNNPKKVFVYLTKFQQGHTYTASKIRGGRSQNYASVGDYRKDIFENTLGIKIEKVSKGFNLIYNNETTFVSSEEYKLNKVTGGKDDIGAVMKYTYGQSNAEAAPQREAFFNWFDFLSKRIGAQDEYGNVIYNKEDFIRALMGQQGSTKSMLRRMAPVRWKFIGQYTGQVRYEHTIPAQWVLTYVADMYLGDGSVTRATVDKLLTQYEVALIPKTMDDQIPMGALMARGYKPGDSALRNRYYTIENFGKKDFYAVQDLKNPKVILGRAFTKQSLAKLGIKKSSQQASDSNASQKFILAMKRSLDPNAKRKGASIIDFDDTLAKTKSNVLYTLPNGAKGKIDATDFALRSEALEDEGAVFDFSEFSKVKAGKRGPFFNKAKALKDKFGNTDIFVLTARPQNAAPAIQKFLSGVGLDLKLENIVGLENGTPEAKADWITGKVAEGYNDILFADDAIKNTKAVAKVLDVFNIGGKIYQARIKFSQQGATSENLNKILDENNPDSPVVGRDVDKTEAAEKGRPGFWLTELFNLRSKVNLVFVPPSAEDLKGLWDNHIAGKGRKGESDKVWFEETILRPYARAERAMDRIKLRVRNQINDLKKRYGKDFVNNLYTNNVTPEFTEMDAVRVYLFQQGGHDTPGITTQEFDKLIDYVMKNDRIKSFADDVFSVLNTNIDTALYPEATIYPPPTQYWKQQDINSDVEFIFKIIREVVHGEFIENRYSVFTPDNMNKIEAIYGTQFRQALEDMFYRMEEGVNRNQSQINNPWIKWLNFATGNIMFVNVRSALLQFISSTNFIELTGPNNLFNTLARVLDSKQWAADFKTVWNSEFLKVRRGRGKIDVVQEEIQRAVSSEKDPFLRLASILQNKGYAPTRFMDSLAIAFGGAAYYRNQVNYYVEQGMNIVQAERTAMRDFREKAEASQQSARADLISMQQASVAGRIFLTFQNVTMQYTRLGKKALSDMKNGRRVRNADGTFKSLTDSRLEQAWQMGQFLMYQNLLFAGLQKAIILLFALGEGDEVEEKQKVDYLNAVLDSVLRGSGIVGGMLSVAKNIGIELSRGNRSNLDVKVLDISPTISTKFRKAAKIINAIGRGDRIDDLLIEVPSFVYGLPTDRVVRLIRQIEAAIDLHDQGYKSYERILMGLGWSTYDFGLPYPPSIIENINIDDDGPKKKSKKKSKSKSKSRAKKK